MARIVVCGYMLRHPVAGNLFAFFHYVLGLCRLGHEVVYLEESGGWENSCYDPVRQTYSDNPDPGFAIVRAVMVRTGAEVPLGYVHRESGTVRGMQQEMLRQTLREADLLLNVGGLCWLPDFLLCRRRALVDMDPLFTQVGRFGGGVLGEHHVHFSYGANIGRPGCTAPSAGFHWLPAVPPVVPDLWQGVPPREAAPFTTVASWNAYGSVTYQNEAYGQKDQEILRLLDLPARTSQGLELALSGGLDVRARLRAAGWSVRDGAEVSQDVDTYRAYIAGSRGEFSAAKHAYVKSRSGWFSDRSVCYLAAGLPVILQDTGVSDWLPTGHGVLAFSSPDEAVDCLERVTADYPTHCRAAREIAASVFDYRVALPRLLEAALGAILARPRGVAGGPVP
jgi:hypothetical protein